MTMEEDGEDILDILTDYHEFSFTNLVESYYHDTDDSENYLGVIKLQHDFITLGKLSKFIYDTTVKYDEHFIRLKDSFYIIPSQEYTVRFYLNELAKDKILEIINDIKSSYPITFALYETGLDNNYEDDNNQLSDKEWLESIYEDF